MGSTRLVRRRPLARTATCRRRSRISSRTIRAIQAAWAREDCPTPLCWPFGTLIHSPTRSQCWPAPASFRITRTIPGSAPQRWWRDRRTARRSACISPTSARRPSCKGSRSGTRLPSTSYPCAASKATRCATAARSGCSCSNLATTATPIMLRRLPTSESSRRSRRSRTPASTSTSPRATRRSVGGATSAWTPRAGAGGEAISETRRLMIAGPNLAPWTSSAHSRAATCSCGTRGCRCGTGPPVGRCSQRLAAAAAARRSSRAAPSTGTRTGANTCSSRTSPPRSAAAAVLQANHPRTVSSGIANPTQ